VLVASLESLVDGGLNLTGLSLPCSKTQLTAVSSVLLVVGHLQPLGYSRDGGAGVELNCATERHDV
jgi:hypothetical protein